MNARVVQIAYLLIGALALPFIVLDMFPGLFLGVALFFFTISVWINSDANKQEILNFISNSNMIQEKEIIREKTQGVNDMEAEIIGFEKQMIRMETENKETKKKEIVNQPIAVITLRSDVPDMLPVGKIVDVAVKNKED